MPSKRSHTKSRLGCSQCKRRKIKCDAHPPCCGPCSKKGLECDYRDLESFMVSSNMQLLTPENFNPRRPSHPSSDRTATSTSQAETDNTYPPPVEGFSSEDLALMHHYTLHTAQTVAVVDEDDYHFIWQNHVPQLACGYPFLMHALLSISAAHVATTANTGSIERQARFEVSRHHYSKALNLFNSGSLNLEDDHHVDALFCFSILTLLSSLAFESQDKANNNANDNPIGDFANVVAMLHGAMGILQSGPINEKIQAGKVGPLLRHMRHRTFHEIPHDVKASLDKLGQHVVLYYGSDSETAQILSNAVHKLHHLFTILGTARPMSWSGMLSWPIAVSSGYANLLSQQDPAAMAIFAHWCVPLHFAPSRWFIGGWGKETVQRIDKKFGNSVWKDALEWPVSEVLG